MGFYCIISFQIRLAKYNRVPPIMPLLLWRVEIIFFWIWESVELWWDDVIWLRSQRQCPFVQISEYSHLEAAYAVRKWRKKCRYGWKHTQLISNQRKERRLWHCIPSALHLGWSNIPGTMYSTSSWACSNTVTTVRHREVVAGIFNHYISTFQGDWLSNNL